MYDDERIVFALRTTSLIAPPRLSLQKHRAFEGRAVFLSHERGALAVVIHGDIVLFPGDADELGKWPAKPDPNVSEAVATVE